MQIPQTEVQRVTKHVSVQNAVTKVTKGMIYAPNKMSLEIHTKDKEF